MIAEVPAHVLDAYDLREASLAPISIGWINRTFEVARAADRFVLQKLHPVFRPEVNLDIDAITRHLEHKGVRTPRPIAARDGRLWVDDPPSSWRLLSFVEGRVFDAFDPDRARSAGTLIARFHRALGDLHHEFAFTRPGAHDTAAHLAKLRGLAAPSKAIADLAAQIGAHALAQLPPLPARIVHGDLKATNVIFEDAEAIALVDLDTLAHGSLAVELGDALRSWGNRTSESDPEAVFDAAIFAAAMEGYAAGARGWIEDSEVRAIAHGIETIAIELAARFCADAIEDRYFGWDSARFSSRVEHNVARARSQLGLARSVHAQRAELDRIAQEAFGLA